MLDRLYEKLPKEALSRERFEIPEADCFLQGNKTILKNFSQIMKAFNRDEKHFYKFVTKELAVPAAVEEGRLLLNSKFSKKQIDSLIESYAKQFVLCHECGKPDTKIVEEHGAKMLKCEACGAVSPVRRL